MASTANNTELRQSGLPPSEILWGRSLAMREVRRKVEALRDTTVPVLLQGESGTGKGLIANLIHQNSPHNNGEFVAVNCAAIPGELIESELFGFERGAFTGAVKAKLGLVEVADEGTLFLDEIGDLDASRQAKLLTFLEHGMFARLGGYEQKKVNTRLISATNHVLNEEAASGAFRQDLYYRLNVVQISLPPLRERVDDIPVLLDYLLQRHAAAFKSTPKPFSTRALRMLEDYHWPGNIRELENLARRYAILGDEDASVVELFNGGESMPDEGGAGAILPLKQVTKQAMLRVERELILKALRANGWNRKKTAQQLDISYRALLYKIRGAGLPQARMPREESIPEDLLDDSDEVE